MYRRIAALTLTLLTATSLTAFAADGKDNDTTGPQPLTAAAAHVAKTMPLASSFSVDASHRPMALPALWASYGVLQAMDFASTRKAIASGAHEANPLMKGGNPTAMLAVKAATGAATIYFSEKAWKKNRVGGIVLMAALNGATAAIVAHNMQNVRR